LAGGRRLAAIKELGWEDVEAHVMSVHEALDKLKIEISENENRKPFTFSEKMLWAEKLKSEIEDKKRAASLANLKYSGGSSIGTNVHVDDRVPPGKTIDVVAKEVGIGSGKSLQRAEYVLHNATPEMIEALDEGQLSINAAYNQLKSEVERLSKCNELLEQQEDQASKQVDEMELEAQRLKEELERLRSALSQDDSEALKRQVVDVQEFSRRTQEEAVKYEMEAKFKGQQLASVQESRKAAEDRCRELEAQIAELNAKHNGMVNGVTEDVLRLQQCCNIADEMLSAYASYTEKDYADWSRPQIAQSLMALNALSSTLATISNSLRGMRIENAKEAC